MIYCHIVAPVAGRVGLRQVDAGNYVQTSDANGIVVITQEQPISVIFSVTEDNLPAVMKQLHAGAKLQVQAYDRSNTTLLATRHAVQRGQPDQHHHRHGEHARRLSRTTDDTLFPNQFVNARLLVDTLHNVVRVPVAAVQQGAPGSYRLRDQPGQHGVGAPDQAGSDRWRARRRSSPDCRRAIAW